MPTRIADTLCSLVDIVFVLNYCSEKSEILTNGITDHLPIFIVYGSYFLSSYVSPHSIKLSVVSENIIKYFYNSFKSVNSEEIFQESNVNRALDILAAKALDCYNQCYSTET